MKKHGSCGDGVAGNDVDHHDESDPIHSHFLMLLLWPSQATLLMMGSLLSQAKSLLHHQLELLHCLSSA